MQEYNVSLRKPNNSKLNKLIARSVFLNTSKIFGPRKFFIDNFGVDPPIINGDQMPLHHNESASQRTLNFTGWDTYVKEN